MSDYMQSLIDEYIRQQLEQNESDRYNRRGQLNDMMDKLSAKGNINDYIKGKANGIVSNSALGNKFQNSQLGQGISKLNNGISNINNTINNVKNLPTDFAQNAIGQGMQKAGNVLANKVPSFMSNGLTNIGSKLASNSAGTLGGQISSSLLGGSGAMTGAAAGTTAAATGATTAATGAATGAAAGAGASGAAAAGGAAGGSAAGGLAAAGPVGALAALAVMAIAGSNRKRASSLAQNQLAQTDQLAKAGIEEQDMQNQQTMQNTEALMQEAMNNQASTQLDGDVTGGASNVENPYQTLNDYQQYLTDHGYDQNVVNGVAQGLNSGNKDIDEWIKQYAQSAEAKSNGYTIPQTTEAIDKARQIVQQTGQQNVQQNVQQNPIVAGNVGKSLDQNKLINKLAKGIADFQTGYSENRNTAFKPENLMQYEGDSKGFMQRLGEGIGTTTRIAQNPAVQGLVAGGLSAALTGNPMAGLVNGYKFANTKNMSDMYQNQLKNQGIDTNVGATGRLTAKDFEALMTPSYKDAQNNLAREIANNRLLYQYDKLKRDEEYRNRDLKIKQQNANTSQMRANKVGTKSVTTKSTRPQNNPSWNKDLAQYSTIMTDSRYANMRDVARTRFINKYGIDPQKHLKLKEGL